MNVPITYTSIDNVPTAAFNKHKHLLPPAPSANVQPTPPSAQASASASASSSASAQLPPSAQISTTETGKKSSKRGAPTAAPEEPPQKRVKGSAAQVQEEVRPVSKQSAPFAGPKKRQAEAEEDGAPAPTKRRSRVTKKRAADEGFVIPAPKHTRSTRTGPHVEITVAEQSGNRLASSTVVGEDQAQQSERPLLSESAPPQQPKETPRSPNATQNRIKNTPAQEVEIAAIKRHHEEATKLEIAAVYARAEAEAEAEKEEKRQIPTKSIAGTHYTGNKQSSYMVTEHRTGSMPTGQKLNNKYHAAEMTGPPANYDFSRFPKTKTMGKEKDPKWLNPDIQVPSMENVDHEQLKAAPKVFFHVKTAKVQGFQESNPTEEEVEEYYEETFGHLIDQHIEDIDSAPFKIGPRRAFETITYPEVEADDDQVDESETEKTKKRAAKATAECKSFLAARENLEADVWHGQTGNRTSDQKRMVYETYTNEHYDIRESNIRHQLPPRTPSPAPQPSTGNTPQTISNVAPEDVSQTAVVNFNRIAAVSTAAQTSESDSELSDELEDEILLTLTTEPVSHPTAGSESDAVPELVAVPPVEPVSEPTTQTVSDAAPVPGLREVNPSAANIEKYQKALESVVSPHFIRELQKKHGKKDLSLISVMRAATLHIQNVEDAGADVDAAHRLEISERDTEIARLSRELERTSQTPHQAEINQKDTEIDRLRKELERTRKMSLMLAMPQVEEQDEETVFFEAPEAPNRVAQLENAVAEQPRIPLGGTVRADLDFPSIVL